MEENNIIFIGQTNWRNRGRPFGIRRNDRRQHMYVVGQTGTGKTTLLETLIRQDIVAGEGLALVDPHGDLAGRLQSSVPPSRTSDLIVVDPADPNCRYRFNPLSGVDEERRSVAAASLLECLEKLWPSAWGVRLEHILRNTLLLLLEQPGSTLADIPRLYDDPDYRRSCTRRVTNPEVRRFWASEFGNWSQRFQIDATAPILNKIGAFLSDPLVRRLVTEQGILLDFRMLMDTRKIVIINLAKGRLGGTNASLMGALILSRIELAALERVNVEEALRPDFWVYLDEFQNFMTLGLASMLSELRKYRVGLVLAHQFIGQLTEELRKSIFGNAGTFLVFRVGLDDARYIEPLFSPVFGREDLAMLPNYSAYVRLIVDGRISSPFSADVALPPPPESSVNHARTGRVEMSIAMQSKWIES